MAFLVVSPFIHSGYYYSASSGPLLLRSTSDTARILCRCGSHQRRPSHWGNEAEIFIIAILRGNKFFAISGEEILYFRGKEILVHERLGDVSRGKCKFRVD